MRKTQQRAAREAGLGASRDSQLRGHSLHQPPLGTTPQGCPGHRPQPSPSAGPVRALTCR